MKGLVEPLLELESYHLLLQAIEQHHDTIMAVGVGESQKNHMLYGVNQHAKRPFLFVTHNEVQAKKYYEDLQYFFKDRVSLYPSKDMIFYSAEVYSSDLISDRFKVISAIQNNKSDVVVCSFEALFDPMIPQTDFNDYMIQLEVGRELPLQTFVENLILMGYERVERVEAKGQFSVRGGIIDFYPMVEETAYRIEWFDDEIDSIRELNIITQRSEDKQREVTIFPAKELLFQQSQIPQVIEKIQKELQHTIKQFDNKDKEKKERLEEKIAEFIEKLQQGVYHEAMEAYFRYFYQEPVSFLDYISNNTIVVLDEPLRLKERYDVIFEEFLESMKNRLEEGYILPSQTEILFNYEEIVKQIKRHTVLTLQSFSQQNHDFKPKVTVHFTTRTLSSFQNQMSLLIEELKNWKSHNYKTIVLSGTKGKGERLIEVLREQGVESSFVEKVESVEAGQILITTGSLYKGFEYPLIQFVVVSDKEIFGEEKKVKRRKKREKKGRRIESFTDLKVGDYVVHEVHGIGIYRGIEKMTVDGVKKDYMKISYADGGNIYITPSQMDMIQKYIGAEGKAPKLSKLGGTEWKKAKAKVKQSIDELAHQLVELYAKRNQLKGFSFSKDTVWQRQFEEMFPYEETPDQWASIEEIKKDMESNLPMDRLLCGDVGYGKTEVAIRAAFKAVQDGKQVAYLVPTTILAQQHYNTFVQRMKDFPIHIGLLSRFRTPAQQKEVIKGVKEGTIDIVIGTHRILSKDMIFKDLGLIIVDEEQRFGVSHKEKLKTLKTNVDVLTLTATPIPRTLHMSLTGIRDMSVLEEPPEERYPVQTFVIEQNPPLIRDAILREIARGGQVFYVHNVVKNIHETAEKLRRWVPEAKIQYAHGQMAESELEEIMLDFIDGQFDVLVCTTIIETGVDISNVNTIIIEDADKMGLSQLYQLRGRVGRSNRLAYAYMMYKKDKVLKELAEKRLKAIKEFTEFGSGFKIAMRDLEIRGAGNLLGAEQHGHMASIGYDLYTKLLEEAVRRVKGDDIEIPVECYVDINVDGYIPERYIENEELKIEAYKRIASIETIQDLYDIEEELVDRYGDLPKSVQHLLQISYIKSVAEQCKIFEIKQRQDSIIFKFDNSAAYSAEQIKKIIIEANGSVKFTAGAVPYLSFSVKNIKKDEMIKQIKQLLEFVKSLNFL